MGESAEPDKYDVREKRCHFYYSVALSWEFLDNLDIISPSFFRSIALDCSNNQLRMTTIKSSYGRAHGSRGPELKYSRLNEEPPRLRPPKAKKKDVALAFFLFAAGLLFIVNGLAGFWVDVLDALAFLALGAICFIPGAYFTSIIVQTWWGVEGYSYDMIPNI